MVNYDVDQLEMLIFIINKCYGGECQLAMH